jgi:hypothetical protein
MTRWERKLKSRVKKNQYKIGLDESGLDHHPLQCEKSLKIDFAVRKPSRRWALKKRQRDFLGYNAACDNRRRA